MSTVHRLRYGSSAAYYKLENEENGLTEGKSIHIIETRCNHEWHLRGNWLYHISINIPYGVVSICSRSVLESVK